MRSRLDSLHPTIARNVDSADGSKDGGDEAQSLPDRGWRKGRVVEAQHAEEGGHALDCDLVYAFVPRGSYADVLDRQIDAKLSLVASQVSQTMLLENQLPDDESAARLREASAERLLAKGRLWDL